MRESRLHDESPGQLEQVLLRAGRSYRASPEIRSRTLSALGLAGTTAISASAAGSASVSLFAKLGGAKLIAGLAVACAIGAVPVAYSAWQERHAGHAAPNTMTQSSTERAPSASVPSITQGLIAPRPSAEELRQSDAIPVIVAEATPQASTRRTKPNAQPNSASAVLSAELRALDGARSALSGGDPQRALTLLAAYARQYPRGALGLEAEVLRIDALAKSGQLELAKQRARSFVQKHPNSMLTARIRRYVSD
jgi:hypothetical protein